MAISDQLTLLNNSKQAIKNSINAKGGSITDSTPFADYSTAIDNLPSGGSGNPLLTSIDVSDFSGTTFNAVASYITDVTIPNGVTTIDTGAFSGCTYLTSVTIPSGVTSLGREAFYNCTNLTTVNIPSGVTYIQQQTFSQCYKLESITLPNNLVIIGVNAFFACQKLKTITLPATISEIARSAFASCTALESIVSLKTTPPTLASSVFDQTNNCPIYVPAASVDTYKAASGWSSYASRIYPITQVATVDGNPVYNYEIGMTNMIVGQSNMPKMPSGNVVVFAEGVTGIQAAINGYTTVTLPSTLTNIMNQIGMIGSSVTTLTCLATTPPSASSAGIGGDNLTHLYVPASSIDAYKAHSAWSKFSSIIEAIPGTVVTSITFVEYQGSSSPGDWGDLEGCSETINVNSFEAASSSSTFDSDIKDSDSIIVEDNNGNDITSQCTFSSNDYSKWDSTQDPSYDGESEAYYEWRLDTYIDSADAQNPHSATITATYGNLSDTFTIEWTTTSNCEEPEPDPEEPEE